jgi:hypothetical protein
MKNLINIRSKTLLLLTFVLLINISGFAQKKKAVTPKKTVGSKKVVKAPTRRVAIYLNDGSSVSGTFVTASPEGIRISILEKTLTFKWKDIVQIFFMNYQVENYPTPIQEPIGEPVKSGEINRAPFEDLADQINSQREKGEIDLSRNFIVVLEGTINADGKLDPKKSKFVKSEGDEQMVRVAKSALQALGDSGFLGVLKERGIDTINLTVAQNDNEFYAILLSDMKTPEKAATAASGLNFLVQSAILVDNNGMKKLDDTAKLLLINTTLKSEGKNFRLDFKLPKEEALVLIRQTLNKRAEKRKLSQ